MITSLITGTVLAEDKRETCLSFCILLSMEKNKHTINQWTNKHINESTFYTKAFWKLTLVIYSCVSYGCSCQLTLESFSMILFPHLKIHKRENNNLSVLLGHCWDKEMNVQAGTLRFFKCCKNMGFQFYYVRYCIFLNNWYIKGWDKIL